MTGQGFMLVTQGQEPEPFPIDMLVLCHIIMKLWVVWCWVLFLCPEHLCLCTAVPECLLLTSRPRYCESSCGMEEHWQDSVSLQTTAAIVILLAENVSDKWLFEDGSWHFFLILSEGLNERINLKSFYRKFWLNFLKINLNICYLTLHLKHIH